MLIKRTKGERVAYMDGYEAGYNRGYERGRKTTNFEKILRQAITDNPDKKLRHIICNMYTHCENCRIQNVCKPWKRLENYDFDKKFEEWLKKESEVEK